MSEPITREEQMLFSISEGTVPDFEPITRKELFLAKAAGMDVETPNPITREEMLLSRIQSGGEGVTIKNQDLTIEKNGTYKADSGYTGLGTVKVNVEGAPNGTAWERTNESLNFTCVEYGDGVWCAGTVGNGIYYSTDGKTWNPTPITGETVYTVSYNGQYWFAGADTGIYSCSNGTDWSTADEHKVSFSSVKHIVSDHGTSIAIASNGWICVHRGGLEKGWSSQIIIYESNEPAYGDNTWVIGAPGKIMVSHDDGITWTEKGTNYTEFSFTQFAYGNGVWVGVMGAQGRYVYSTDRGENWIVGSSNSFYNRNPEVCAYKDGMFVMASYLGEMLITDIYYSVNGNDWASAKISSIHGKVAKIFNYNGVWVALRIVPIENDFYNSRCGILYSIDGITWQESNITENSWLDVAVGKNEWVAVGPSGSCHSTTWKPN